ncbi:uncharacterized protein DNG_08271 [Cephalotrichum gorgonifer]|uniref:C2H2-type domain-containing protein n=1 Tax=Cephalotrichum gorgonifer TaxID=2041049 RepID=A0AAE8N4U0_9PEZI|nr:uncharacterized protein DNG_08271 [Cephalotrichum gorgonifer]
MDRPVLPPHELLHYSAAHKVLICTTCRYAVQPGGLTRHLKDIHHIYRGKRRPYLEYAGSMELKDPKEVTPPTPAQFPVPHLPIEWGWRCSAPGCDYMCVSDKRMETHWPATHGRKGSDDRDWTAAPLQTFFRGNMLRYFTKQCIGPTSVQGRQKFNIQAVSSSMDSLEAPCPQTIGEKYLLDPLDYSILEHYLSSTSISLMLDDDALQPVWIDLVPKIALNQPFLLHGILACTALHMAHLDPLKDKTYTLRALAHQETAIPLFRHATENPTVENCDALVIFAYLLTVYSFATDMDNVSSPLLMVDDRGSEWGEKQLALPQWLHFIRAGCVMLCDVWDAIEAGPAMVLAYAWEVHMEVAEVGDGKQPYLEFFLSVIPRDSSWSAEAISAYESAATKLAESFAYVDGQDVQTWLSTWNTIGVWPARLEDSYFALLAERHPGALILLAHYCLILKPLDDLWYFHGRPAKLLASIMRALDEKWHPFIRDAVKSVIG